MGRNPHLFGECDIGVKRPWRDPNFELSRDARQRDRVVPLPLVHQHVAVAPEAGAVLAVEMYRSGVSTRKVAGIAEALGAGGLSKDQVSRIRARLDAEVEDMTGRLFGPDVRFPACKSQEEFPSRGLRWESWTETRSIAEPAAW